MRQAAALLLSARGKVDALLAIFLIFIAVLIGVGHVPEAQYFVIRNIEPQFEKWPTSYATLASAQNASDCIEQNPQMAGKPLKNRGCG